MSEPFNLVPGKLDINAVTGDDFSVLLDFSVDLTGYTFDARVLLDNNPYGRYHQITITNTNLALGRITLSLSDTQTRLLGPISNKKWFISWSQGADIRTVLSGGFTLNQPWAVTDYSPTTTDQTIVIQTPTISVEVIGGVGGAVLWGDIQGDIEDQTDLIQYITNSIANQPFGPGSNIACVFEGDSIMAGFGVGPDERMSYLFVQDPRLSGIGSNYWNVAESGNVLADIISDYPSEVYPRRPSVLGVQSTYLFVEIGTNDIFFNNISNVNTYFSQLSGYWQQAKADGFTVISYTICPRKEGSAFNQSQETIRQQLNKLIRNSYIPDFFIDMAALLPDPTDSTYYPDGTHPSAIANAWLGRLMADTVANQVSSNLFNPIPFIQNSDNNFQDTQTILGDLNQYPQAFNYGLVNITLFQHLITRYFNYRVDPTAATNQKVWWYGTNNGQFQIGCANDALTEFNAAFIINRSGATPGSVAITSTISASNLSGTNTGDQYGGVTTSTALRVLRRNAANTAYEFATLTGSDISGVVLTSTDQSVNGLKVFTSYLTTTANPSSPTVVQTAGISFQPIISQSGTAGYDVIRATVSESSTGSGAKNLIRMAVSGTDRFTVSTTGIVTATGDITGSNLSGTNTGDQYGGATASAANQYLRRNSANSAYEYAPKTEYITIVPTDGQAIAFNDNPNDQVFYINPAGDLTDLQLILPSNATSINTQKVVFCVTHNITNLDLTGATTIFNAPVTMNAGDCFQFYKMASNVWARVIT